MAQTDSDKAKGERIIFAISASERDAIDNWRYDNRVPSRSEAIRALIRMGLDSARTDK